MATTKKTTKPSPDSPKVKAASTKTSATKKEPATRGRKKKTPALPPAPEPIDTASIAVSEEVTPTELVVEIAPNKPERYNRRKIAQAIAHTEGLTLAQAERITQLIIDIIIFAVSNGSSVYLPNLGKFEASYMPPRSGRHPRTHDPMIVKEGLRLKFVAATPVNRKLNEESENLMPQLKEKLVQKRLASENKKRLQEEQQTQLLLPATEITIDAEAIS